MSWIDRINQWAIKRIRPWFVEVVTANVNGIEIITANGVCRLLLWAEIEEIAALAQPTLATGSFTLAIRGPCTSLTLVDGTAQGFFDLCEEIPHHLDGAMPFKQWSVELMADPNQNGKVIFRREESLKK